MELQVRAVTGAVGGNEDLVRRLNELTDGIEELMRGEA